jgi:carboxypeptidase C (cathepsin A)
MTEQDMEGKKKEETTPVTPKDVLVETKHSLTIDGQEITYTVTCGTMVLKEEAEKRGEKEGESEGEKPRASIFFVAYTRDGVDDLNKRPLTFSFNGGPGSSSVVAFGIASPRWVLDDEVLLTLHPIS